MDFFGLRLRLFGLMLIVTILFPPSLASSTQSQGDIDTAIDDAIAISVLESDKNADALYRWMHPDAQQIVPKSAVVGWYTNDFFPLNPQPISEILDIQFISWTWPVTGKVYPNTAEIRFMQPFGSPGSVTYQEETVRLVEVDGQWRWFFGRNREFVDEQIARFPDTSVRNDSSTSSSNASTASRSLRSSSSTSTRSSSGCTLVELYPGYPGYRGVITGMLVNWSGVGDWECLETLERVDPTFDKAEVDAANLAAARELGIQGQPSDWVWENWMQIEAVRGLPAQCYSCVIMSNDLAPLNTSVQPDFSDPRIQVGFSGQQHALRLITSDGMTLRYWGDDYELRAAAYFWNGQLLNAPQLFAKYQEVVTSYQTPGGATLDVRKCLQIALEQGGYTWVPDTVRAEDQYFLMGQAWWAATASQIPPVRDATLSRLFEIMDEWYATSTDIPLREYLAQNQHRLLM